MGEGSGAEQAAWARAAKWKELVLAAVQQSGFALKHADESLRADRELVLAAVQQRGGALENADERRREPGGRAS